MDQYLSDARIFKAFCDENRLQILELLRTGEKCACALLEQLHISQSTLSYHMRILCDSGPRSDCWLSPSNPPALLAAVSVGSKSHPKTVVFLLLYISKILEVFL